MPALLYILLIWAPLSCTNGSSESELNVTVPIDVFSKSVLDVAIGLANLFIEHSNLFDDVDLKQDEKFEVIGKVVKIHVESIQGLHGLKFVAPEAATVFPHATDPKRFTLLTRWKAVFSKPLFGKGSIDGTDVLRSTRYLFKDGVLQNGNIKIGDLIVIESDVAIEVSCSGIPQILSIRFLANESQPPVPPKKPAFVVDGVAIELLDSPGSAGTNLAFLIANNAFNASFEKALEDKMPAVLSLLVKSKFPTTECLYGLCLLCPGPS